jgi:hypothetical protein
MQPWLELGKHVIVRRVHKVTLWVVADAALWFLQVAATCMDGKEVDRPEELQRLWAEILSNLDESQPNDLFDLYGALKRCYKRDVDLDEAAEVEKSRVEAMRKSGDTSRFELLTGESEFGKIDIHRHALDKENQQAIRPGVHPRRVTPAARSAIRLGGIPRAVSSLCRLPEVRFWWMALVR